MNRRALLGSALAVAVAGCYTPTEGEGDTATETFTATPSPDGTDVSQDICVVLLNLGSGALRVGVDVQRAGGQFFSETVSVPSEAREPVFPGITEPGAYRFRLSLGPDRTESFEWEIGSYDLRMGSNAIVTIDTDDVRVKKEQ
jgi:hypothetical protein